MLHPDKALSESWTSDGDVNEMFRTYEGWDPRYALAFFCVILVLM